MGITPGAQKVFLKPSVLQVDFFHLAFLCSAAISRKCRILDVVYNASNNELVRTKTLVKNCIVLVDCTPFKQW